MTLVNCKISNYPLGEPDNQNPSNVMEFNNSVNNNTLPSHVKLVIKPNNNNENPNGFYAVRAADFHIGGLENYLNQLPDSYIGFFQGDDSTSGSFPSMVYPIEKAVNFGDVNLYVNVTTELLEGDPAITNNDGSEAPLFDQYTSGYSSSVPNSVSQEYFGLGYSPPLVERNQLSKDLFGDNIVDGGSIPGRIYHYHGRNSNETLYFSDYDSIFPSVIGTGMFPSFTPGSNSFIDPSDGEYASPGEEYLVQFIGTTFAQPPDFDGLSWEEILSLLEGGSQVSIYNQENKGIDKTTSWTHINRIMICDSMSGLGAELDDPDNYPIDNEVYVWVEFKNSYALNALPENNPELWDIKVDIDGAAKFIEY